ncbi:MAG TPA: bifunctional glutamate N-acetyltransferase/amino-acid acetyltransferase ArgJ [Aggregatilineales bacterium]|nr:bifunctional glutamate N-acetyltransferase/amino-acid acetyltransferase ArgJ [Anaerolineales bacterium]HRE47099.1 bifunctional glutamate N-acetyltransferase/amino-acid acetyltransferase ArgJ [Aggregatilineales bacterium]
MAQLTLPVKGFRTAAVDAGLYASFGKPTRPDLTLVAADRPCTAAGMFTTNRVKAAPVILDESRLKTHAADIRAVLINTASANASTGADGLKHAELTAGWAAHALGCRPEQVLVMSTGVIGVHLPMAQMDSGITKAAAALSGDQWDDAARAIMTTDTRPKMATVVTPSGYTITGIAKGAGMIAPNMATMLSLILTDAQIAPNDLQTALHAAVKVSFNRIVVDGDMSTNDTVLVLASGASGRTISGGETPDYSAFVDHLTHVCASLAEQIVRDGEGATKFIHLTVSGAAAEADALQVANTIATSALVKTAFYGGDPNWGRILAAAGRSGVALDQMKLSLWYDDLALVSAGTPLKYDEAKAKEIAGQANINVRLDLGMGEASAIVYTCDLSHDYVSINGHYRT